MDFRQRIKKYTLAHQAQPMNHHGNTKTSLSTFSASALCKVFSLSRTSCRSSMTIEAALCLSLFIFASVVLMIPLLMIHQQRNISRALESNARLISKLNYIEYVNTKSSHEKNELAADLLHDGEAALSSFILQQKLSMPLVEQLDLLSNTEIDVNHVKYVANYNVRLPFSVLGMSSVPQQVISSRRSWIGAKGNRWMDNNGNLSEKETIVYYSTRESNVYHSTLSCSYISHDILTASGAEMASITPKYGGRFHPCLGCRPSKNSKTVYYTAGGRSYHAMINCKTLSSYIQEMPLSKAKALGKHPCIRCGS